jgi:hypothetical protein
MNLQAENQISAFFGFSLRTPGEPMPPIKEPPSPIENPDAPVREPDPEEPQQI